MKYIRYFLYFISYVNVALCMFYSILVLTNYRWKGDLAYPIIMFNLSIVFPLIIIFSLILLVKHSNSYGLILKRFILFNLLIYLLFIFIGYIYSVISSN